MKRLNREELIELIRLINFAAKNVKMNLDNSYTLTSKVFKYEELLQVLSFVESNPTMVRNRIRLAQVILKENEQYETTVSQS